MYTFGNKSICSRKASGGPSNAIVNGLIAATSNSVRRNPKSTRRTVTVSVVSLHSSITARAYDSNCNCQY